MHTKTVEGQSGVVSLRDAARRCGMSQYLFKGYVHRLDVVPQHGVTATGTRFTRDMYTLASVERLRMELEAERRAA